MTERRISIAMTTFNGEKFLQEQLESLLNQTYSNIEILICDDCSTDGTLNILSLYKHVVNLKYIQNKKRLGVAKNFEKVLSLCCGDYIALADQDDIWEKDKIQVLYENIGDALLIHSDAKLIDQNNNVLSESYFLKSNKKLRKNLHEYFFDNDVTGCTALFKKELLEPALPFPANVAVHDWWLAICASKHGKIKYLDRPLIAYRQHQHNQIGAADSSKVHLHLARASAYEKTLLFLQALHHEEKWDKKEKEVLEDLIAYYEAYFSRSIRLNSFLIHLKYFSYFFNDKSLFYRLVGLALSFLGENIQKRVWRAINK
ncbi:MAG: glycosyltransferase family 2 protein [Campylobacterales bacterium]|nr:glycosyltransferase family 2 protein [Campylobacterales bacterium]